MILDEMGGALGRYEEHIREGVKGAAERAAAGSAAPSDDPLARHLAAGLLLE